MKTKLTGGDLITIHDLLTHQLRISNNTKEYKQQCVEIANKISSALDKVKVELKDTKGRKHDE